MGFGFFFDDSIPPQDLFTFFQAYGVADYGIYIINGGDGRPSGEAFVLLSTEDAASRAVVEKNRERIGERWVELYQVSFFTQLSAPHIIRTPVM